MKSSLNGTKSAEEVKFWVAQKVEENRSNKGVSILVVNLKSTGSIIGYCGLTLYPDIDGSKEIEIGYRLIRKHWGHGYATEAASAVRDYAFGELKLTRLVALIEPINQRSISVAKKIGMSSRHGRRGKHRRSSSILVSVAFRASDNIE